METANGPVSQSSPSTARQVAQRPSQDTMVDSDTQVGATPASEKNKYLTSSVSAPEIPSRESDLPMPDSVHPSPFETDIEAMMPQPSGNTEQNKVVKTKATGGDSDVWPGQNFWKRKAKEEKIKRSCTCLSRLNNRTRLIVRVLIGVLIIGLAIAVGFGVSKPLGAPIWSPRKDS